MLIRRAYRQLGGFVGRRKTRTSSWAMIRRGVRGRGPCGPGAVGRRRGWDQPVLAQPDQEGGVAFIQQQAGRLGYLGELAGEVDEVVAVAVGAGGQDQQPIEGQQVLAAGQDLLEGLEQGGLVDPAALLRCADPGQVEAATSVLEALLRCVDPRHAERNGQILWIAGSA